MDKDTILSVRDLRVSFSTVNGTVSAIRGVSFDLLRGETLAIVGESGSGKSVTAKAIMGIMSPNQRVEEGSILFSGGEGVGRGETIDILKLTEQQVRRTICGKRIAMVFQDPMTSLDPTVIIGKQIVEGMREHYGMPKAEAKERALELLREVGIEDPAKRFKQYPHQLSGGMRQRVVIAISLACDPDILICDEPTTALDVTIQWRILELIKELQLKKRLTVIFITHNLGVVAKVADSVCVMYAGRIVEEGTVDEVYYDPRHPYTWGLMSAMPDLSTDSDRLFSIPGSPANLLDLKPGDPFAPRNPFALRIDLEEEPPLFDVGGRHRVASWLCHPSAPRVEMPAALRSKIDRMLKEVG